jgi:hypothetical protein
MSYANRLPATLISLLLFITACTATTSGQATTQPGATVGTRPSDGQTAQCPTEGEALETAKLYIEHNATDADTGVHGLFGGEAWSELCLWDPNGQLILMVDPQAQLNDLTVSDLFFESREPPNDEFTIDDLKAAFPEGDYMVGGTDFNGTPRVGVAVFTHQIPAAPVITSPAFAEDEETAAEATVSRAGMVVRWDPVTATIDGGPLTVIGYQVIITKVDHEDPNGFSRPVYDVHIGPEATSLSVPREFFEPETVYELEVLALETSGNQTISVGFFTTD